MATERTCIPQRQEQEERTETQRAMEAEIKARITAQMLQCKQQRVTDLEEEIACLRLEHTTNPRVGLGSEQTTPIRTDDSP